MLIGSLTGLSAKVSSCCTYQNFRDVSKWIRIKIDYYSSTCATKWNVCTMAMMFPSMMFSGAQKFLSTMYVLMLLLTSFSVFLQHAVLPQRKHSEEFAIGRAAPTGRARIHNRRRSCKTDYSVLAGKVPPENAISKQCSRN